jgi:NitT/TauT family transport system ATP-binding protein
MIRLKGISKSFTSTSGIHLILNSISFDINTGFFTTIFGPNGCGKTTLMNIFSGIDKNYTGTVERLNDPKQEVIGFVFQDFKKSLLPWYTVKDNILFPLELKRLSSMEKSKRLEELLSLIPLKIDLDQRVNSLSGGQAQAVCILRALIIKPSFLILDEPFAAIDYEKTLILRNLISNIAKIMKLTVLFISHDLEEAIILGDQVIFLSKPPTEVVEILEIDLPYPRLPEVTTSSKFNILKDKSLKIFHKCIDISDFNILNHT